MRPEGNSIRDVTITARNLGNSAFELKGKERFLEPFILHSRCNGSYPPQTSRSPTQNSLEIHSQLRISSSGENSPPKRHKAVRNSTALCYPSPYLGILAEQYSLAGFDRKANDPSRRRRCRSNSSTSGSITSSPTQLTSLPQLEKRREGVQS